MTKSKSKEKITEDTPAVSRACQTDIEWEDALRDKGYSLLDARELSTGGCSRFTLEVLLYFHDNLIKDFSHTQLVKIARHAGGSDNFLKGILRYTQPLLDLGFSLEDIVKICDCSDGWFNLEVTYQKSKKLMELGFLTHQIVACVAGKEGPSKLITLFKNYELWKSQGLEPGDIIGYVLKPTQPKKKFKEENHHTRFSDRNVKRKLANNNESQPSHSSSSLSTQHVDEDDLESDNSSNKTDPQSPTSLGAIQEEDRVVKNVGNSEFDSWKEVKIGKLNFKRSLEDNEDTENEKTEEFSGVLPKTSLPSVGSSSQNFWGQQYDGNKDVSSNQNSTQVWLDN